MNTRNRNITVDVIRGFAMLLVVMEHTLSGTVSEYSDSLLFQITWTLQIPLFIIISGYVTRFSRSLVDGKGLGAFIKKRSLAYLLPWVVWTILVRGLIFGQLEFLNIKHLLWHMDSGYWFLVTIWSISMIFGFSDFLSNKWFKKNHKRNVLFHFVFCGIGMIGLAAVGYLVGLGFFAIKLTLYYIPFYLLGYLYGKIQDWMMSKANTKTIVNCAIVVSLGLWLAMISRFEFYASSDGGIMVISRFITSLLGCTAVIGIISASCAFGWGEQQNNELSAVCETRIQRFLNWVGIHSLEVYLIHGFSLCILKYSSAPVLHSVGGWVLVALNFMIAVTMSCIYIRIIGKITLLNKLLFWK